MSRYYPQKTGQLADQQVFDAHKRAFDEIYALHDKLTGMHADLQAKLKEVNDTLGSLQRETKSQVSNTKINGFLIKPTVPTNGQTLKFNSSTGQIEWQ